MGVKVQEMGWASPQTSDFVERSVFTHYAARSNMPAYIRAYSVQ